jgi:oligosaccharide repeat unit polymerase
MRLHSQYVQGLFMIELILIVLFAGIIFSRARYLGSGNPFQIYFWIWFSVIFSYYLSRDSYYPISFEFEAVILITHLCAFLMVVLFRFSRKPVHVVDMQIVITKYQYRLIMYAQIIVIAILPLIVMKANNIAHGNIFTIEGYTSLRAYLTDMKTAEGYGFLGYFTPLSFVVSSITVILYQIIINRRQLVLSIITSLFYAYLSTGRTFILVLMTMLIMPLVNLRAIKLKTLLLVLLVMMCLFVFIAAMTNKGVSSEASLIDNVDSFLENIRSYTVAPFLAFAQQCQRSFNLLLGQNSFRFFFAIFYSLGLTSSPPVQLIHEYAFVPDATNVYTVYGAYFQDFGYFGMVFPLLFLVLHYFLFRKQFSRGGVWIFYYSASVYPLIMQFFQDQYFSLLSTWIQIVFWYWLFLSPKKTVSKVNIRLNL